jgi:hypothetical protein
MKLIVFAAIVTLAVPALAQETPPSAPAPATTDASAEPQPGGYAPPPAPPPPPGATIVFKEAPPPDVVFPPPAPLASYPVCKRGQFDKCVQRHDPK